MAQVGNKKTRFDVSLNIKRISGQTIVETDLSNVDLSAWCLALCLLKESLIDNLVLNGSKELSVKQGDAQKLQGRAALNLGSQPMEITISPTELDYWLSFFLKYYRDGVATVDHLDVEAEIVPARQETADVILKVKDARSPVPSAEAKKILGIT